MAYTVTFPTQGPQPHTDEVAAWLVEQGEAYEQEGPHCLQLRALPVRLVITPDDGGLQAHVEVTPQVALSRLIDMLFELSMRAGADVRLAGAGELPRPALWMRLADEQDRLRIGRAIAQADEQGKKEEVVRGLWGVLAAIAGGRDIRWDAARERIVELKEVDEPGGLSLTEAAWHMENPASGDVIAVEVQGTYHILAWRWLSEAFPGLADP